MEAEAVPNPVPVAHAVAACRPHRSPPIATHSHRWPLLAQPHSRTGRAVVSASHSFLYFLLTTPIYCKRRQSDTPRGALAFEATKRLSMHHATLSPAFGHARPITQVQRLLYYSLPRDQFGAVFICEIFVFWSF